MDIKINITIPDLGSCIKQARESKRLSQKELGDLMNLSSARISELENEAQGKSTISMEQLFSLENHLDKLLIDRIRLMELVISTLK